jgi:hypothetical protein
MIDAVQVRIDDQVANRIRRAEDMSSRAPSARELMSSLAASARSGSDPATVTN